MIEMTRPRAGNYVMAAMLVAIATVLQSLAIRFGGVNLPFVLYYPLLAGAAWATSFLFGVVSTVASGILVWTLFLSDPAAYTQPLPDRLVQLGTFMLVGVLVCALAAMLRHTRLTNDRARRREAAARQRLEAVLQALPHGVIAADANGRVTYLNAAAAALVGCTPEDATGGPRACCGSSTTRAVACRRPRSNARSAAPMRRPTGTGCRRRRAAIRYRSSRWRRRSVTWTGTSTAR